MKKSMIHIFVILLITAPLVSQAQMTAKEVMNNMKDAYKEQMEGVKDMTKKTDQGVKYQKWEQKSGETTYKLRNEQKVSGQTQISVYDGKYYWTKNTYSNEVTKKEMDINPMVFFNYLESMDLKYAGTENVNGKNCHALKVENADLNKMVNPTTGEKMIPAKTKGMQEATVDATFFIDGADWVMVKSIYDIKDIRMQNKTRNAKTVMINDDFRTVKGVIIPYHTEFTMEMDMSAEEKKKAKEARKSMKKMKEKMKDMPPEKRKMMKEYMPQMKKAQSILMTGQMEKEFNVKEVKINTGIPDKLFDGSQL
ncbi:MAG: hypothetical protein K9I68_03870 [Bacteroidales bacterium]|nr:hypothetical protein [Bacteroidales bacterium]MCF8337510.1 hypothetical protein [Bacteroidales bacterium]